MKKVVVIGGGFAGSQVAMGLEKEFDVTLVDRKEYFEYTPGVLRGIQDLAALKGLRVSHEKYLKRAKIVVGEVKEVSDEFVSVGGKSLDYDYLVVASGGKSRAFFKGPLVFPAYSGKDMEDSFDKVGKAKKIVVVGGGLVGVELAAELAEGYGGKGVMLVHPGEEILERQAPRARLLAAKWLEKQGVELVLGEMVVRQAGRFVVCKSGRKLGADVVFSCVGVASEYDFLDKRLIDDRGVKVDENLRVVGAKKMFAVGDVTAVSEEKTAQNAELQAHVVVGNIKKLAREEIAALQLSKGENSEPSARIGSASGAEISDAKVGGSHLGLGVGSLEGVGSRGGDLGLRKYRSGKRIMAVSLGSKSGVVEIPFFGRVFVMGGWVGALAKWFTEKWVMRIYR